MTQEYKTIPNGKLIQTFHMRYILHLLNKYNDSIKYSVNALDYHDVIYRSLKITNNIIYISDPISNNARTISQNFITSYTLDFNKYKHQMVAISFDIINHKAKCVIIINYDKSDDVQIGIYLDLDITAQARIDFLLNRYMLTNCKHLNDLIDKL